MKTWFIFCACSLFCTGVGWAQRTTDTASYRLLKDVVIATWNKSDISHLPDEQNGYLYAGKKNEVISII
ncbi:MAG: hypothetical protein EBZ77_02910 [Chitinophagia bacterium]|nr:hypothetical protein [Chitinophagia bacterium]